MIRKTATLTAALVAAVVLWLVVTQPPRFTTASGDVAEGIRARTVAGAFHVHSTRSDGAGDRSTIARAAAGAGLTFVILTDHGDATRTPDPPAYVDGVLCIDSVEISTNGGHLIALDMPAAPYPLGGEAAAVVEDVLRLGGMPVAAHPDSPKQELAWKDWAAPIGGLEWMNLDSGWRDETRTRLARVALDSFFRPGPALASLLDRESTALARWDEVAARRAVVGFAGHDAHGGLSRAVDEGNGWNVPRFLSPGIVSYEASFATFALRAVLDERLTGDAAVDARRLLDAVRAGRVYTAIDAIAGPAWVDYHAMRGEERRGMGDTWTLDDQTTLVFRSTLPSEARAVLLRDGVDTAESRTGELTFLASAPGAYRVEVRSPLWNVPWIVTNPIYLRGSGDGPTSSTAQALRPSSGQALRPSSGQASAGLEALALVDPGSVERDPASTATLTSEGGVRWLEFALRSGDRASQYAALAVPLPKGLPRFDRIVFNGRASAPMRVSVQLRVEQAGGARWIHSVYLTPEPRQIVVPIDQLLPADAPAAQASRPPPFSAASSVLFVVDLTNASPGARGRFGVSDLRLASSDQSR
jgi:hypothetical protein